MNQFVYTLQSRIVYNSLSLSLYSTQSHQQHQTLLVSTNVTPGDDSSRGLGGSLTPPSASVESSPSPVSFAVPASVSFHPPTTTDISPRAQKSNRRPEMTPRWLSARPIYTVDLIPLRFGPMVSLDTSRPINETLVTGYVIGVTAASPLARIKALAMFRGVYPDVPS